MSIVGSTVSVDSGTTAADIKTALSITNTSFLDVYPVGSIYMSVDSTFDPETTFGGSWSRIAQGRMLVGLDDASTPDTDFDTAEKFGGFKTHTLTVGQLPPHTHTVGGIENPSGSGPNGSANGDSSFNNTLTTSSTGSGEAHPIMNPYLVVCMWKRTA